MLIRTVAVANAPFSRRGGDFEAVGLDLPGQRVRAGGGHELLRDPAVQMVEAGLELPSGEELDGCLERQSVELHVREVLEQDVDRIWRAGWALELLAGENRFVGFDERVEAIAHDDAEMLATHLVDALVDRRDELDHRQRLAIEYLELIEHDQRDRAAIPHILTIGARVTLQLCPDANVLVPLGTR